MLRNVLLVRRNLHQLSRRTLQSAGNKMRVSAKRCAQELRHERYVQMDALVIMA
jgi:hypothetical protein